MDDKKKEQQDFIVEKPIIIEEKVGKNGEKIRKYERGKFLGKGGFAKCYEIKSCDTNKIFAAKLFEKKALTNDRSRKKLINEIKLHKRLHHQNIVNFEHFFEDQDNVYILLELCSNQTLNELLKRRKRLTEIEVIYYMTQIINALKYIHSHKIIHRDLKLGNCFINSNLELKLGDFGLAAKLEYEGQRRKTVCGTPNYIAPEILEKKNGHSYEVDVWSLGVVAYTLIYGKPPFETADVKLTYKKIKMNNYVFPESIKGHPSAKKLISSILVIDPIKRPSLDTILNSEYFKLYSSLPSNLSRSTLACPPSKNFIDQYRRKDDLLITHTLNSERGNKLNPFHEKYNSTLIDMEHINNFINENNLNTIDNIDINELIKTNSNILNHLIESGNNPYHRKSESCNNFVMKEKNSLNVLNNNCNNSRNNNKNEILTNNNDILSTLKNDSNRLTTYIDYSTKFGYVFISPYHIGIFFNDNSNIIKNFNKFDKNYLQCSYYDKTGKNKLNLNENGLEMFLKNKSNPKDMIKKFEIIKHVLAKHPQEYKADVGKDLFLIKKIIKTQQATLFRLNNKIIQSFFLDKAEVTLSTEGNECIYKEKNEEEKSDSIFGIMNSNNNDMIQRIKYIKSILMKSLKEDKLKK